MGKHNKHPDRSPGRNNNDLAANQPSKAKLAYKIIIFATATVKLITEILHHTEAYLAAGETGFGWWLVEHYFSYHIDCPDGCDSGESTRGG